MKPAELLGGVRQLVTPRPGIRLAITPSAVRAEIARNGSVIWSAETTYASPADLAEAVARLAGEAQEAVRRVAGHGQR